MIQIQELIKHFVLGIASLIICSIAMADIGKTKEFMKNVKEVLSEYPEETKQLKEIVEDWAELKIEAFQNRRSWVRATPKDS